MVAPRPRVELGPLSLEDSAVRPARKGNNKQCLIVYGVCSVCSAIFTNHDKNGKNRGRFKTCRGCRGQSKSDAHKAAHKSIRESKVSSWLSGEWDGAQPCGDLSDTIWNYLRDKANNFCQSESCPANGNQIPVHPIDGRTILEVNHINGNGLDHRPENLEVICPTCHALTPTYRGRNQGNGRPVTYIRKRK